MLRSVWVCVFLPLMLAACEPKTPASIALATEAAETPAPTPDPNAEPLDPFVVMINSERWGVIIDRALEGVIEAPDGGLALTGADTFRADAALKNGAASLLILRNRVCGKGLVSAEACDLGDWPAWALEPPTADVSLEVLDQRGEWLSTKMTPFEEIGCAAGRKASADDYFCSVE